MASPPESHFNLQYFVVLFMLVMVKIKHCLKKVITFIVFNVLDRKKTHTIILRGGLYFNLCGILTFYSFLFFKKKVFGGHMSFFGPTGMPFLDFW